MSSFVSLLMNTITITPINNQYAMIVEKSKIIFVIPIFRDNTAGCHPYTCVLKLTFVFTVCGDSAEYKHMAGLTD